MKMFVIECEDHFYDFVKNQFSMILTADCLLLSREIAESMQEDVVGDGTIRPITLDKVVDGEICSWSHDAWDEQ